MGDGTNRRTWNAGDFWRPGESQSRVQSLAVWTGETRWTRVERLDDGVHLHGYYTAPYARTTDLTNRRSVLVVERPGDLERATVSLTTDENRQVHFDSTEGVVSLDG